MAKQLSSSPLHLSGKVGDLVFCRKRDGSSYVRAFVPPNNPDTEGQRAGRSRFREAVAAWQALPPQQKDAFRLRALGTSASGYNLFISEWLAKSDNDT